MNTLNSLITALLISALVLGLPLAVKAAGAPQNPPPSYSTAPTGVTCSNDTTNVTVSWDNNLGAPKYAVQFNVGYDTDGVLATAEVEILWTGYATTGTSITLPISTFNADVNGDLVNDPIVDVEARVKGLTPDAGFNQPQKNKFSAFADCGL